MSEELANPLEGADSTSTAGTAPGATPTGKFVPSGATKYCHSCGNLLDARAELCPNCGVRQQVTMGGSLDASLGHSRVVAALLAILLGTFGIHKFYLGKVGQGVLSVLFFWTFIPALVAFIEGVWYLTMSDEEFQARFPRRSHPAVG